MPGPGPGPFQIFTHLTLTTTVRRGHYHPRQRVKKSAHGHQVTKGHSRTDLRQFSATRPYVSKRWGHAQPEVGTHGPREGIAALTSRTPL